MLTDTTLKEKKTDLLQNTRRISITLFFFVSFACGSTCEYALVWCGPDRLGDDWLM